MEDKYIISVGRQLGSGGRQIGEKLADKLGIFFYDKELINLASEGSGLNKDFFEKADEKGTHSLLGYFFENSNNYICNESLFKIQSEIIKQLAKEKSCVFVGRCADYILRENTNLINIFITADKEDCAKRTAERKEVSEKKALDLNYKVDKKRKEYYNFYTGKSWGMAKTYHLSINSSLLGIDETVKFIEQFIRIKLKI